MSLAPPPVTPLPVPAGQDASALRTAWIDHLRIALTFLVVLHHVAIAYGGSGGWYWKELPDGSSLPLVLFNAVNQSFFMGFFFLLAGYYTPPAYERKGPRRFLAERLLRLGVPLLVYSFVLSPLTVALSRNANGEAFGTAWLDQMRRGDFEPGPLWFAEALLLLAVAYVAWRALTPRAPTEAAPTTLSTRAILLAALAIGAANVLVRLWMPVGQDVLGLQLGYFPAYLVLFAAGAVAARTRWVEQVLWSQAWPWLLASLTLIAALPFVIAAAPAIEAFVGGLNPFAVTYAFWDPFVAAGIILTLLYSFRTYLNQDRPASRWIARRAYGVFIVHPPAVVACSLTLRGWAAPGELKFLAVGLLASLASLVAADLLLRLPGAKRVL